MNDNLALECAYIKWEQNLKSNINSKKASCINFLSWKFKYKYSKGWGKRISQQYLKVHIWMSKYERSCPILDFFEMWAIAFSWDSFEIEYWMFRKLNLIFLLNFIDQFISFSFLLLLLFCSFSSGIRGKSGFLTGTLQSLTQVWSKLKNLINSGLKFTYSTVS